MLFGWRFQLVAALAENAEQPKLVALNFKQPPLDQALVFLKLTSRRETNSCKVGASILPCVYI